MFKNNGPKEIEFWAMDSNVDDIVSPPEPASRAIPQWYRGLNKFLHSDKLIVDNGKSNVGLKTCVPFLDAMISGYIVRLHCDIMVTQDGDMTHMNWTSPIDPLSTRGPMYSNQLPRVNGFGPFAQAWELKYAFRVPKGYSVLVTQPINRLESVTLCTTGIIDADDTLGPGGIPFALQEGFEGIIPAGTPIAQLFPYKRDEWIEKIIEPPLTPFANFRARNVFYGWYKKNIWKKKNYG